MGAVVLILSYGPFYSNLRISSDSISKLWRFNPSLLVQITLHFCTVKMSVFVTRRIELYKEVRYVSEYWKCLKCSSQRHKQGSRSPLSTLLFTGTRRVIHGGLGSMAIKGFLYCTVVCVCVCGVCACVWSGGWYERIARRRTQNSFVNYTYHRMLFLQNQFHTNCSGKWENSGNPLLYHRKKNKSTCVASY